MSLVIKNSRELLDAGKFRWKVLIFGIPGVGKSEWATGSLNPGYAACETGHGKGLLTGAYKNIDYIEPTSVADFEAIASGRVFQDKDTIVLDSLTSMSKTFIKDAALAMPRMRGNSDKRAQGVPELDDYQVMSEITRRLLAKLLELPKHIIVTATEKYSGPDPETGQGETIIAPDLPGALSLTSTAMFDTVLRLKTRQRLADPKDPKTRYVERYFITQPDGQGTVAKTRTGINGKSLLDKEETFDLATGRGTFSDLLRKIKEGYGKEAEDKKAA